MDSIYTEKELRIMQRQDKNDAKHMDILKKILTKKTYENITEYMSDSSNCLLKFVRKHDVSGKKQDQDFGLKEVHVAQSCGYSGDDYSGNIWIKITKNHYLRFYFSC
jgi:hypothetical protein